MQVITGQRPLFALGGTGGTAFLTCRLSAAGATAARTAVQVTYDFPLDRVQWAAGTPAAGTLWRLFGVTLTAGEQDDYVPVAIYGPVKAVTLPAAVTKTDANSAVGWGGTRAAGLATVIPMAPGADLALAEVTDTLAGAKNSRDLFLFGREFLAMTLLRAVHRVQDHGAILAQSLKMDAYGRGWILVDAAAGLTAGKLTLCRRGQGGGWKAAHGAGGALADAVAGGVFLYGVPALTVAASAGAVGPLQVLGQVDAADLHAAVNTSAANEGILWTSAGNALSGGKLNHPRALAAAAAGNLRNRPIHLLGRIFYN